MIVGTMLPTMADATPKRFCIYCDQLFDVTLEASFNFARCGHCYHRECFSLSANACSAFIQNPRDATCPDCLRVCDRMSEGYYGDAIFNLRTVAGAC